jgi:hypothetical protein
VTTPSYCYCPTTSATAAFTASSVLENIMSLGASAGTYFCYPGYEAACTAAPTSPAAQSSATGTTSPQSRSSFPTATSELPSSTLSTSTSTSDAIASTGAANAITSASLLPNTSLSNGSTGLSNGAETGVIAGGTVAALGICALCVWFCRKLYRPKQKPTPIEEQIRQDSLYGTEGSMEKAASDADDPRSPAWSGHKSELPADSIVSPVTPYEPYRPSPRISEIQESPMLGGRGRPIGPGVYEMPG